MSADPHWENLKEIFLAAVALAPTERRAYLDRACAGDTSQRRAVEALLTAHEETGFIDEPAYQAAAEMLLNAAEFKPGQAVAHFRILSLLGEGGMGKIYLAQDTKLQRKVALKFLPAKLAGNQDHMRRFAQEAKLAAGLHHPNIAQIFEIGNYETAHFIAMEYVEGETLRQLLSRRKLEIKKAVEFAAQIASGLATAHQEGIIHRDIKPENLVVTTTGQIKILDFGLAKLVKELGGARLSQLTTAHMHSSNATTPGVIMGTVSYMSPEQARGEKLDQRTDIFSLGVVLYEMITGDRPFRGKSAIDTLHAITNQDPAQVTQLNSQVSPELADILSKALAKETSERYQHAGDFELDLRRFKRALESNLLISTQTRSPGMLGTGKWSLGVPLLLVGAFIVFGVAAIAWLLGRSTVAPKHSTLALANVTLTPLTTDPGYEGEPTFSADGETIAYVSDRTGNFEIYLKQISGGPDINITNNGADDVQPAFSPDGKQIAFVSTRSSSSNLLYPGRDRPLLGGDIWVMPALGGSARRIIESGNFPSWSADGKTILFTSGTSQFQPKLRRVDAQGGTPQDIPVKFKADEPLAPFWFYSSYSSDMRWISFEADGNIFVVSSEGGEASRIVKGRRPTWGANSQSIIYSNDEPGKNNSLWQIPFSTTDGIASGPPEPLTVGRGRDTQAAISRDGKLIAFAAQDLSFNIETLAFDAEMGRQTGASQEVTRGSNNIDFLSFSPDSRSIVFQSHRGTSSHIWRVEVGSAPVQLTSDPNFNDSTPRWSPDAKSIAFIRNPVGVSQQPATPGASGSLWLMSADGANPRLLSQNAVQPEWAPSGLALVYGSVAEERQNQLFIIDLATKTSRRLTNESAVMTVSAFSPDGKWLIYQSNQSGNVDLRAVPIEGGESRSVVATAHQDYHPFVSPSGRWLYFQLDHKNIYRVPGPAQEWRKGEPEKVTNFPESGLFLEDPQISRDGHQLLYSRGRLTGDVWIMNLGK